MNWKISAQVIFTAVALVAPALADEGDPVRGSELFPVRCIECHSIADAAEKKIGPSLKGVIGRASGTLDGYDYSEAMKAAGIVWSEETLKAYLVAPRKVVPGTKMNFNGLKRPGEVEDIVAYLLESGR
ncbi:MAG: c-type cytochrome [Paracoccaceae bacterium]